MKQQFENIQFWRLFACVMVFMVHFGQRIEFVGFLRAFTDFGSYGVQLFFIISGFLISNSYENYGKNNLKIFYYKKLISILPLYYCVIAYYFIVHTFILKDVPQDPTGFGWIRYLFVLNNLLPKTNLYFWDNLGITWTIPYFMFAYLILPLALKVIKNVNSCLVLLSITIAISFNAHIFNGWFSLLYDFPLFVLGLLLYFTKKEKKDAELTVLACLSIIFLLVIGQNIKYTKYIYCALFFIVILTTTNYRFKSDIIKKVLKISDKYSYTLYLAHGIVFIHCLDRVCWNRALEAIIAIFGSLILTLFINNCIEAPIKKHFNNLIKKSNGN